MQHKALIEHPLYAVRHVAGYFLWSQNKNNMYQHAYLRDSTGTQFNVKMWHFKECDLPVENTQVLLLNLMIGKGTVWNKETGKYEVSHENKDREWKFNEKSMLIAIE